MRDLEENAGDFVEPEPGYIRVAGGRYGATFCKMIASFRTSEVATGCQKIESLLPS